MRTRDTEKEELVRQKAVEMIVKEGLDGFSMQKLAKAARISPATLYIYYKDRDDLLNKVCFHVVDELLAVSLRDFHPDLNFADGMAIQWRNRMEYFLQHPMETAFIEQVRYAPFYAGVQASITSKFGSVLGPFVHRAIDRGELQRLPFEVYWSVAFAPLYQLMKFHSQPPFGSGFKLTDPVVQQTLSLVLKALKP